MQEPVRVVQYGVGPIGLATINHVLRKESTGRIKLVGAIDVDPAKVGKDVAELLGRSQATGIKVSSDAKKLLEDLRPDVVLHTTSSFLGTIYDQFELCAAAGCHVVSSTEELSYPYDRHPELAEKINNVAMANGVTIVGTGVNPGYAMDSLALMATGVCAEVSEVHVRRIVDAGKRRKPLQAKVGAGITSAEFEERKATGKFGHIGLRESLLMVADGLGWIVEATEETLEPVISDRRVVTPFFTVEEGSVAGIHHRISGTVAGKTRLTLSLQMYVGAMDPIDAVQVIGDPPIHLKVDGGIFGDTATLATLINTVPLAIDASPGLKTTKDLPPVRSFASSPSAILADVS
jgi:4-hydroxy-tetrahydrodipicolinate reductase